MAEQSRPLYSGPVLLLPAVLLFGFAILEKVLNLFGASVPFVDVYPSWLLNWAVVLLTFEIAMTLRQILEQLVANRSD